MTSGKYSAHVEHDQTLDEESIIEELADSIQPSLQKEFVALVVHRLSSYIANRLKRGYHLSFCGFNIGYSTTGGFDAANSPFDPLKHKLNVIVSPRNRLKDSAAYMTPQGSDLRPTIQASIPNLFVAATNTRRQNADACYSFATHSTLPQETCRDD